MFAGIVPSPDILEKNISWESHLLGGLVGITVAWMFRESIIRDHISKKKPLSYAVEEVRSHYFPSDTFEKTKWEKYQEEQQSRIDQ